ncbi:MAG: GIY-YIG nuclease family protein [Syntrophomonadaceae bacterium]|nr:GIY-YIG nuclease family protein [Syntrophomonadaceae bacterium]
MSGIMGYVYILTNPSFKDNWVKIGKSSREVDVPEEEIKRQIGNSYDLIKPKVRKRNGDRF